MLRECAKLEPEDLRSSGWVSVSSQGLMGDSRRRRHRGDLWWTLEKVWRSLETRKDLSAMEVMSKVCQCRMRFDLLWKEKACLGSRPV
ncbi:hypothetical protein SUGI_0028540 [Cryptomeria japonica]|nr:hypothetical protein SUGI_0028540 [Cryptomeria japonica]